MAANLSFQKRFRGTQNISFSGVIAGARMRREEIEAAERREKEEKRRTEERRVSQLKGRTAPRLDPDTGRWMTAAAAEQRGEVIGGSVGGVQTFGEGVVPEVASASTTVEYAQSAAYGCSQSPEPHAMSPTRVQLSIYEHANVVEQQEEQQKGDLERQYLQHLEQGRQQFREYQQHLEHQQRLQYFIEQAQLLESQRPPHFELQHLAPATEPQIQDLPRYLQLSAHHLAHGYMAPMIQLLRAAFAEGLRAGAYAAGWAAGTVQFHAQGQQQWQMPYSFHLQQYPFQQAAWTWSLGSVLSVSSDAHLRFFEGALFQWTRLILRTHPGS
ncbi:hypothetical protein B0H11DRAFT_2214993 [Mycena galericulata]|nr:hypothetical protein B0H11DRAFT_2214993 [Mycena galericulata]